MRNLFDQLAKRLGKGALDRCGLTVVQDEIARDAQHADLRHEPDPACSAERAKLGLLGRMASVVCLIEVYGHAPGAAEVRACLGKYIAFWQQRDAQARAKKGRPKTPAAEPFLWVLTAGRPTGVLKALGFRRLGGWPRGVYGFGGGVLHVGLVVASELPRTRETLLVRLMAGGPLLPRGRRTGGAARGCARAGGGRTNSATVEARPREKAEPNPGRAGVFRDDLEHLG